MASDQKRHKTTVPETQKGQKVQRTYAEVRGVSTGEGLAQVAYVVGSNVLVTHQDLSYDKEDAVAFLNSERAFIEKINDHEYRIKPGFVPHMLVPGTFFVNDRLSQLVFDELEAGAGKGGVGGFLPAVRQVANVAALPGIVGSSLAMPDMHSGYGFAIGNVAAFDMDDERAVVSPGGVGFDINCGVRLIRTNLKEDDVKHMKEEMAAALFKSIPVGVGSQSLIATTKEELERVLTGGIDWSVEKEYAWPEDKEHCEEYGCMAGADPSKVSARAKKRGMPQMGTLGAGNHYAEVQVVDEIFNQKNADAMGIGTKGQVCIMIHSGSRGLGHQVATDYLQQMEKASSRDKIPLNDKQLASALIHSQEGKDYLAAMACAANYAWVNRSAMTFQTRNTFGELFKKTPRELDMHLVYDVCHNIAKIEDHIVDGKKKKLLVHRKGATRAFPPHHPMVPKAYQDTGQPVIIGGTMGTCSYVLTGTEEGMKKTFGSTCHGAGRSMSRNEARRTLKPQQVMEALKTKGIAIKVASDNLVMEEAPESYKNVTDVVETCQAAGISDLCVKLRPIAVIKG